MQPQPPCSPHVGRRAGHWASAWVSVPPLCVAQGASQSLGGSAELGALLGSGLPSGHSETIGLLPGHGRPGWAMRRVPGSLWVSTGWPSEPQRRWGQGPDAQGRVEQGPWATGTAQKWSSPRHPAGSARLARREDAGKGHASPCSSQALPGADGPVAGSQSLGSQVGGWPGLLHQLTCHIDPPVGSIAVDLPPLLCGTKGSE